MRHRTRRTAVALFCILAQLALGASTLGLVVCAGRDHLAIELPSDDCCAGHGRADAGGRGPALEGTCCSDTPLFAAARRITDLPRSQPAPAPVFSAWLAPSHAPAAIHPDPRGGPAREASVPHRVALRAIVLRV
jgi:hypothetical protein